MFLENTITVSKEAVKEFGMSGAIILQILYLRYGYNIKIDEDEWEKLFDFVPISVVKATITKLRNEGKIVVQDKDILLTQGIKKKEPLNKPSVFSMLGEAEPAKKPKKKNEGYAMAMSLCKIVGQAEGFYTPKRYLKFANQLLDRGFTISTVEAKYGKNGWWYNNDWRGKQGNPPTLQDIRKTITKDAIDEKRPVADDFFR